MEQDVFKEQIQKELEKLSRKQQIYFAWVAAVRALPFLGYKGHFNFWKKGERGRYLYAVFNALDYAAAAYAAAAAARAYADARAAAAFAADTANAATDTAAADTARAAAFAAEAARAAYAFAAAFAAAEAARAAAVIMSESKEHKDNFSNWFQQQLLADVKTIDSGGVLQGDIAFYGVIWDNFQLALAKEGCEYWGKLYETIFKNNFVLDKEALKLRLEVPDSVKELGAKDVANYLIGKEKGEVILRDARLLILGDKGAGKTSIAWRIKDPDAEMPTDEQSTEGVDTDQYTIENSDTVLHIWDFAGHVVTHAAHRFFLSERCIYLLVLDGRTERLDRIAYWLEQVRNYGGDSPVIILTNSRDKHPVKIPVNTLKAKYDHIWFHDCFSVQDDKEALLQFRENLFSTVVEEVERNHEAIGKDYFSVYKALEAEFSNPQKGEVEETISKQRYNAIVAENFKDVKDPDSVLRVLSALGFALWYEQSETLDTIVLKPAWVTEAVYKIINGAQKRNWHGVTKKGLKEILTESKKSYSTKQYDFLYNLLLQYKLAFEYRKENRLVLPVLLDVDRPKKEYIPDFTGDTEKLKYVAEKPLPPDAIMQFIVKHHYQIKYIRGQLLVWRYGVILQYPANRNTQAMVVEDDRSIIVTVKGAHRANFIGEIRQSLTAIFNSYNNSKEPELHYRLESTGSKREQFIPARSISGHQKYGVQILDIYTGDEIDPDKFLDRFGKPIINNYGDHYEHNIYGSEVTIIHNNNLQESNQQLQEVLQQLIRELNAQRETEGIKEVNELITLLKDNEKASPERKNDENIIGKIISFIENLGDKNSKWGKRLEGGSKVYTILEKFIKISRPVLEEANKLSPYIMGILKAAGFTF
jgi:GTPase SAR1 family protein